MTKGERIKELREKAGMTQEELAKRLHTTKQTIHKYEKNIVTNIPSDRIEELAKVLDSTPEHILGWKKVSEDMERKSDVMVDITIRIGADLEFREVVKRNLSDNEFFELSKMLCSFDSEQIDGVKTMLNSLLK